MRLSRIGFRMITCKRKVGLKLGVVCMCILWISRSSLIMTIVWQFYKCHAPFCTSNLLNIWFPLITYELKVRYVVCLFDTSYWSYYRIISIFEPTKLSWFWGTCDQQPFILACLTSLFSYHIILFYVLFNLICLISVKSTKKKMPMCDNPICYYSSNSYCSNCCIFLINKVGIIYIVIIR